MLRLDHKSNAGEGPVLDCSCAGQHREMGFGMGWMVRFSVLWVWSSKKRGGGVCNVCVCMCVYVCVCVCARQ